MWCRCASLAAECQCRAKCVIERRQHDRRYWRIKRNRILGAKPLMRNVYLLLAIWGTVHPMYYFITWFQAEGFDIMKMVDAWHVNAATSGLVWDLTIAAVALTIWIIVEAIRTKNYLSLIAIPATYCIGVSCGLPLYLYLRERVVYYKDQHKVRV